MSLNDKKLTKNPKVSILTIAYNQELYIRQTLESLVMQQTDFEFEIIVSDDCSTDKTPVIIKEYAHAYPQLFNTILRKKNLGSWSNFVSILKLARGTYVAICEGDDYWTDPQKLQKQVDFLDHNPNHVLYFHPVKVIFEDRSQGEYIFPNKNEKITLTRRELLKRNYIQTNSVMYRRQENYDNLPLGIAPGDWYLHLYHAQFGKIGFIDQVMSTYRRHPGGLWWNSYKDINKIWKNFGVEHLSLFVELLKIYGKNPAHKRILDQHIAEMIDNLIKANGKNGSGLLTKAFNKYPDLAEYFVLSQHQKLVVQAAALQRYENDLRQAENERDANNLSLQQTRQLLTIREREIKDIKASRFWKARNVVARLIGKKSV